MTDRSRPTQADDDLDPAAPIPNPGLDMLRRQTNVTTNLAGLMVLGSLLALSVLVAFDTDVTVFGSMIVMIAVTAFLALAIIMKILFVLRGGTPTATDLVTLLLMILFLLPAFVASYWLMIATIQQS